MGWSSPPLLYNLRHSCLIHSIQQTISLQDYLTSTLKTTLSLAIHNIGFPVPHHSLSTCSAPGSQSESGSCPAPHNLPGTLCTYTSMYELSLSPSPSPSPSPPSFCPSLPPLGISWYGHNPYTLSLGLNPPGHICFLSQNTAHAAAVSFLISFHFVPH